MDTLSHPAVPVAVAALTEADQDLTPITAIIRDDVVAVLVEGEQGRWVLFMRQENGVWVAPNMIVGGPAHRRPRHIRTSDRQPLQNRSTKLFALPAPDGEPEAEGWFAITGIAAEDAVSVSVTSDLEQTTAPIRENGLAFAVVRARTSEDPSVYVNTSDGRRVLANQLKAA